MAYDDHNWSWKRRAWFALAIVAVCVFIAPFFWSISLSLRQPKDVTTVNPPGIPFVQFEPTLEHWSTQLSDPGNQKALFNSVVVAIGTALMVLLLGTPAAYALARFRFRRPGNQGLTMWFLSQRVLPPVATVIPFFLLMRTMGLLDTKLALILINTTFNLPFVVVIMRQAFMDLPFELEEAAMVDGASPARIFFQIVLPLAGPSLVASVLIVVAFTWNEFLFGLNLGSYDARTVPMHLASYHGTQGVKFWIVSVHVLVALTPPVLMAFLAQRFIVRGLTLGAVKG
jgi:multiple sugar transport system permease protein